MSATAKAQPRDDDQRFVSPAEQPVVSNSTRPASTKRAHEELQELAHVSERTARQALAEIVSLQRQLLEEMRGLRADLRQPIETTTNRMVVALEDYFGEADIAVADIAALVDADHHHPLALAVAAAVDMNNENGWRTQLGLVLADLSALELVGTRRGAAVYRLLRT